MKAIRLALVLAATLLAAACLPVTTTVPVGSTAGFKADPALFGLWKGMDSDKDAPGYFVFLKNDDGSMTALMITPPKGTDGGEWESFALQTAMLGANRFINATEAFEKGKAADGPLAQTRFPLLYRFQKNGKLALYLVDEKLAAAAINAGKIKGTVEPGDTGDVHITADAAALDAFMQSKDGLALFNKPLIVLSKMK